MKLIFDAVQFVSDNWVFFIMALCFINALSDIKVTRGKHHVG
jgi:hypothetical protein